MDFPVQLLIRQHSPDLSRLRQRLEEEQPDGLPPQTTAAGESLRGLLTDMENREGVVDRRFYAVCDFERVDDLSGTDGPVRAIGQSDARVVNCGCSFKRPH